MAQYALSVIAKGQAFVKDIYNAPEQRRKNPTIFELALKNQSISIPNAQELRTSPLRPVELYYYLDVAAGTATAKAYNHTGNMGDTGSATVVYVSTVETISIPQKIAANQMATYQNIFNNQWNMKWKNSRDRQDNAALAYAIANKNQLLSAVMTPRLASANPGSWSDTYKALEIANSNKTQFISLAKTAMMASNYKGEYDVITDLQLARNFDSYANQGAGNQANLDWQFQGITFAPTNAIIDSNYGLGSSLWLPKGLFAGLCWNEQLNKTGLTNDDTGGTVGMLGTMADPYGSGATADISFYTTRADTSANTYTGSTEDFVDNYEITLTVGYILPPLNLASDSVVMEIAQAS